MNKRTRSTRPQQSLVSQGIEFYCYCLDTFGVLATVVFAAMLVIAIAGGINFLATENDRAEMISSVPDGISAECHAKLIRAYYAETPEDHEARLNPEGASGVDACGQIGVAK